MDHLEFKKVQMTSEWVIPLGLSLVAGITGLGAQWVTFHPIVWSVLQVLLGIKRNTQNFRIDRDKRIEIKSDWINTLYYCCTQHTIPRDTKSGINKIRSS